MRRSNMRRFVTMTNEQLTDELCQAHDDAHESENRLNFEHLLEEGGYQDEIARYHGQEESSLEATLVLVAELRRRGVEPPAEAVFWALDDRKVAEVQNQLQQLAGEEAAITVAMKMIGEKDRSKFLRGLTRYKEFAPLIDEGEVARLRGGQ